MTTYSKAEKRFVDFMKSFEKNLGDIPAAEKLLSELELPDNYREEGEALIESTDQDGDTGFKRDKIRILKKYQKQLQQYFAIDQDQEAEQEAEEDLRLTIGKKGKKVFRTLSMDDIDNLPDPDELLYGILQTESASLLYGDSNVGKTFLSVHIAFCVAYGMYFFGRKVKQGRVL